MEKMPDYFKTIQFMLVLQNARRNAFSFGPTTAGRMDVYVEDSKTWRKHDYACERNRTKQVTMLVKPTVVL
jgi:tartrate dehydratase beta subunit/fumarate hydratase class I family protein